MKEVKLEHVLLYAQHSSTRHKYKTQNRNIVLRIAKRGIAPKCQLHITAAKGCVKAVAEAAQLCMYAVL